MTNDHANRMGKLPRNLRASQVTRGSDNFELHRSEKHSSEVQSEWRGLRIRSDSRALRNRLCDRILERLFQLVSRDDEKCENAASRHTTA